jgi:predicted nucleic acid-binding Zn ribbon protein
VDPVKNKKSRVRLDSGPELLGEVLSRLFTARGWGRRQDRLRLEQIWAEAVGSRGAAETRVNGLRRGILEIVVGNAILLQELAQYEKRRLLEKLRKSLPGATLTDLRFKAGVVSSDKK